MKKSTKGAVAAAAAAVLLLGGAGSLAYWSDSDPVTGGDFTSGHVSLTANTSDPAGDCSTWTLDTGEPGGGTFDPATAHIVPGDEISKICAFTIAADGTHLRATVAATPGTNSGDLVPALTIAATDLAVGADFASATPVTEITEADDAQTLYLKVDVTFKTASGNTTQDLAGTLDGINIVTTQVHS